MFRRVIVGVDGQSGGRDAIALASRLLAERGEHGELILAHVYGEMPRRYAPLLATIEIEQRSRETLARERDATRTTAELVSFAASTPGRGLHMLAEQRSADLIVVGSTSRGPLDRVALGDDTRAALNGAPCAVAIARRGYAERPLSLARIGVGYDGTAESEAALAVACDLGEPHRALVRARRVVSLPSLALLGAAGATAGETIEALVEEAREQVEGIGDVDGEAIYGLAEEELTSFSGTVDLLVVGSRGYGPARRMMLGSVSNHLQRHCLCSLLVVPRASLPAGELRAQPAEQARDQPV